MAVEQIGPGRPRATIAGLMGLVAVAAVVCAAPQLIGGAIILGSSVAVIAAVVGVARGERLTPIEWFVAASGAIVLIVLLLPGL